MKKYTPFILPLIIIAVVFVLVYRWYSMRTERMTSSLLDEGVVIENLSEAEIQESFSEAADFETVQLNPVQPGAQEGDQASDDESNQGEQPEAQDPAGTGVIRYQVEDGRVRFSVVANFPESGESYQVFLRDTDGMVTRFAFTLEDSKGGQMGSAAVSADILPVEVVVAKGGTDQPGEVVLTGRIEAPSQE